MITAPVEDVSVDELAFKVFIKAIEILGGPRRLVEYRNLTWVPSLMAASYAVVLRDKKMMTVEEIARFLGLSTSTVKRMLSADPEAVMKKIKGELKDLDEHVAGGLAKEAWNRLKAGEDINIAIESMRMTLEAIDSPPWAVLVLKRIKGMDFPVTDPSVLEERLRGIEVEGKPVEELLRKIEYPIRSPAELLKKLKRAAQS
ncbi:MAG: bacterio-opsin activator [Candidatus Diapherotrites archaeon]|nr:bacterio-opsin activator [Candidatus Diapherotrites archaeon]